MVSETITNLRFIMALCERLKIPYKRLFLFACILVSLSNTTLSEWKVVKGPPSNVSLPFSNITMIKTSKVTSVSEKNHDLNVLTTSPPNNIQPAPSTGNVSIIWPKPLVLNNGDKDNRISFSQFKNHAFHSSDEVSLNTSDEYSTPTIPQGEQSQDSIETDHNTTKDVYPCNKIPNPTLTPNLDPKPRYATIQWRRVVFPYGLPQKIPDFGYESLISPDYRPFYYRKIVNYGQSPRLPDSPSMPMNYYPFIMKMNDYKVGSSKYRNSHAKSKHKRPVFPDFFGRFKKTKVRRKPGFLYQPFPITAIEQEMKPITVVNSDLGENSIRPEDSILVASHSDHNSLNQIDLSDLEPNPRRIQSELSDIQVNKKKLSF